MSWKMSSEGGGSSNNRNTDRGTSMAKKSRADLETGKVEVTSTAGKKLTSWSSVVLAQYASLATFCVLYVALIYWCQTLFDIFLSAHVYRGHMF